MVALQTFIARTPARLMMVNLDDLLLEPLPINQPGTPDQRPNWRRRIATALELLSQQPGWIKAPEALQAERAN
jgi:4-alpha-glucanotransferase